MVSDTIWKGFMINRTILLGNIVNDLEIEQTSTGKNRLRFTLAVNKGYGEKKVTNFIPCVAWEKTAELLRNYCHKGSKICVEGEVSAVPYEKNGQKTTYICILVNSVELLDPKESRQTISTKPQWDMSSQTTKEEVHFEQDALPFY